MKQLVVSNLNLSFFSFIDYFLMFIALDPHSEKLVQDALEKASKGRTTLIVSHRLTTITDADLIVFVNKGVVAESGTHDELMATKGLYYDLVEASKGVPEDENGKNIQNNGT